MKRRAAVAIPLLAVLLVFAFRNADLSRTWTLLASVGPLTFLALTLPALGALFAETYGWWTALGLLGHRVRLSALFRVRLCAEALAQTLPCGVVWCESVKPLLLARHCDLRASASVGAMVARKYLLMVSQAAYLTLVFALSASRLRRASHALLGRGGLEWLPLGAALAVAIGAAILSWTFSRGAVAERVFGLLSRLKLPGLRERLRSCRRAFTDSDRETIRFFALSPGAHARAACFTFIAWGIESLETFLILRALGSNVDLVSAMAIEALSVLLRHVFVVLPAGVGAQEVGYVSLISGLGVGDPALAAAFALLKRAKELYWSGIGYAVLLGDRARGKLGPATELGRPRSQLAG